MVASLASVRDRVPMPPTSLGKKRAVGLLFLAVIMILFLALNRLPKLDAVGGDLDVVTAPEVQCFQGFCIEREPGASILTAWWVFSLTYLRLVAVGMAFAFLVAGLADAFLFPPGSRASLASGGSFKRTFKGLAVGPVMNLCSACIVPISAAYKRSGGGIEGAIALVQGSATMSVPALSMVFFVFTPVLGFSRLVLAVLGALLLGPIVALAVGNRHSNLANDASVPIAQIPEGASAWKPVLAEGFRDWSKASFGYLVRMGPIMVAAGFASGLAIQWISPETVTQYLGNSVLGVAIAATIGVSINVPLLFEIPLVALLLLMGMGTAPAATLLFTAAAGGPVTFWGLARVMPRRAIATFAIATWVLGALGGIAVLGFGVLVWQDRPVLRTADLEAATSPLVDMSTGADAMVQGTGGSDRRVFVDVAEVAGVAFQHDEYPDEIFDVGGGAVVLDLDGDGHQDIFVANSLGPNALYRNKGNGTFVDVADAVGVDDPTGRGNGGCAADYDNDGHQDLFVTNYGPSKLYRGDGAGSMTDVTAGSGVDDSPSIYRSTGCAWGDFNLDGHLDLVVTRYLNESDKRVLETQDFYASAGGMVLFANRGNGTFSRVTKLLEDRGLRHGPSGESSSNVWGAGYQPGWLDFDDDGDLDLYVVNDMGKYLQPNVLWRNDGPATDGSWRFSDVSQESGADVPMFGMGLAVGDYDLNGRLDLFVTNIGHNVLLKNNDGSSFTESAVSAGVGRGLIGRKLRVAWGAVFFDYDNDGDEDLYVVSGFLKSGPPPTNPREQPNLLLRNRADGTFTDISSGSGADDPNIGRGVAYLDFDSDGCLDLYLTNYAGQAKLLRNACDHGNNWLAIQTVGTSGNRDGIGARITISSAGATQVREIAAGSSSMGQNMRAAHFGLGRATSVDSVTVRWPGGKVQTITDVVANQRLTITESQ